MLLAPNWWFEVTRDMSRSKCGRPPDYPVPFFLLKVVRFREGDDLIELGSDAALWLTSRIGPTTSAGNHAVRSRPWAWRLLRTRDDATGV